MPMAVLRRCSSSREGDSITASARPVTGVSAAVLPASAPAAEDSRCCGVTAVAVRLMSSSVGLRNRGRVLLMVPTLLAQKRAHGAWSGSAPLGRDAAALDFRASADRHIDPGIRILGQFRFAGADMAAGAAIVLPGRVDAVALFRPV